MMEDHGMHDEVMQLYDAMAEQVRSHSQRYPAAEFTHTAAGIPSPR